jgi:hypothetical protein
MKIIGEEGAKWRKGFGLAYRSGTSSVLPPEKEREALGAFADGAVPVVVFGAAVLKEWTEDVDDV